MPKRKKISKTSTPKTEPSKSMEAKYEPRLKKLYLKSVLPQLMKRFNYRNIMEIPKISSVSLNMGIGDGKTNNKLYYKYLKKIKSDQIHLFQIDDFNFQNFLDFPVLFNNREKLHLHLFKEGFDTKIVHYFDCSKLFNSKTKCNNSKLVEKKILCLPNHDKINKYYIQNIVRNINLFYQKNI